MEYQTLPDGWAMRPSKLEDGMFYYHHAASNTLQSHFPRTVDQLRVKDKENQDHGPEYVPQNVSTSIQKYDASQKYAAVDELMLQIDIIQAEITAQKEKMSAISNCGGRYSESPDVTPKNNNKSDPKGFNDSQGILQESTQYNAHQSRVVPLTRPNNYNYLGQKEVQHVLPKPEKNIRFADEVALEAYRKVDEALEMAQKKKLAAENLLDESIVVFNDDLSYASRIHAGDANLDDSQIECELEVCGSSYVSRLSAEELILDCSLTECIEDID